MRRYTYDCHTLLRDKEGELVAYEDVEILIRQNQFLRQALSNALIALDAGECESGGDYHQSKLGRHADEDGGRLTCPACAIRRALQQTAELGKDIK